MTPNNDLIRSNNTTDFATDQTIINSNAENIVRNIKIFKDSDVYTNVIGFDAFLTNTLQTKVLEYTLNPFTNLGDNLASILQELEVKLIDANGSNKVGQLFHINKMT